MAAMLPDTVKAMSVNDCEHGSLVQFGTGGMGLVLRQSRGSSVSSERVLLLVLSNDGATMRLPFNQNSFDTFSEFDIVACHSSFRIVPDYKRAVAVGSDDSAVTSGMLLLSQDRGWLLACTRPDGQRYYFDVPNLSKSLPYFNNAVCYPTWDIYIQQQPLNGTDHINIFSFSGGETSPS
jgi:hypothetical protein